MSARKQGAIYDKWHRRVEGQIRHTIGQHPEWFTFVGKSKSAKNSCVNTLAKRIVGEIVADSRLATKTGEMVRNCSHPGESGNVSTMSPPGQEDAAKVSPDRQSQPNKDGA